MTLPNIFTKEISDKIIERINHLKPDSQPQWGKMHVEQMLAHCNVTYEMAYENKHSKPNFFVGLMFKAFVKKKVIDDTPYKHHLQTAPAFIIKDSRKFETEKSRLIYYINKTQHLGEGAFHNKVSLSFGRLSTNEWNNMFYKHLDHHLSQFGV